MKSAILALLLIGFCMAQAPQNPFDHGLVVSGKYFSCYADCHQPQLLSWLVACRIDAVENGTVSNLVILGNKDHGYHSSLEYYAVEGYREEIRCYYSVPIANVTGTSKERIEMEIVYPPPPKSTEGQPEVDSTGNGTINNTAASGTPMYTGEAPEEDGGSILEDVPGVKKDLDEDIWGMGKVTKIELEKDDNATGKENERFKPKTASTPSSLKVTHFTCPSDCPKVEDEYLVRCSILHNFKSKDNIKTLVSSPFMQTTMLETPSEAYFPGNRVNSSQTKKRSKVWTKEEGGKRIYDEVLVCEYVSPQGEPSYAEPQTPYDRLGFIAPPSNQELEGIIRSEKESSKEFKHDSSTCMHDQIVIPPGYARIGGEYYEVEDDPLDWASSCYRLPEHDYGLVRFLNLMDESEALSGLLAHETVEVIAPGFEGCVKFEDRITEVATGTGGCSAFGHESAMLYISEDALDRLQSGDYEAVLEEEWGKGIVFDAYGIGGLVKKIGAEIMMLLSRIF